MCVMWCGCSLDVDFGGRGGRCWVLNWERLEKTKTTSLQVVVWEVKQQSLFLLFIYIFSSFESEIVIVVFCIVCFCTMHTYLGGKRQKYWFQLSFLCLLFSNATQCCEIMQCFNVHQ